MSLSYEITNFLEDFEPSTATTEQVKKLEEFIQKAVEQYQNPDGVLEVADSIYDTMISLLKKTNPESAFIKEIWQSQDDTNLEVLEEDRDFILSHPMRSINTVKGFETSEFSDFVDLLNETDLIEDKSDIEFLASMKINGHGIRMVYKHGIFQYATSRGRRTNARDITTQVGYILDKLGLREVDAIKEDNLTEFRLEVALPFSNLEQARTYNSKIVNAFTGVSSLLRESTTREEAELLDLVVYAVISDKLTFDKKSDEYEFIEQCGFTTPLFMTLNIGLNNLEFELHELLESLREYTMEDNKYEYFTDGVVVQVNDNNVFNNLGSDSHHNFGNIALKMGAWSQDGYSGYLQCIDFTRGKSVYTPVAIISDEPYSARYNYGGVEYSSYMELKQNNPDLIGSPADYIVNYDELGVQTVHGGRVKRVPLYSIINILNMELEEGSVLHFKYGGESGVVPCNEDGSNIKSDVQASDYAYYLLDDYEFGTSYE